MKRKVCQVGPATLMVSLPSKWAREYNVKKGDEINLLEDKGSIHLSIDLLEISPKKEVLNIPYEKDYMKRLLVSRYLRGANEIKVVFKDRRVLSHIQRDYKLLMGFEIIRQNEESCILKNISEGLSSELDTLLDRFFNVILSFNKDLLVTLKNRGISDLDNLREYEYNANRINLFCRRMINLNNKNRNEIDNSSLYLVLLLLERVADELNGIVNYLDDYKIKNLKITNMTQELSLDLEESLKATLKKFTLFLKQEDYTHYLDAITKQREARYKSLKNKKDLLSQDSANNVICHYYMAAIEHLQHISEELI